MTVSTTKNSQSFVGDGATTDFVFTFACMNSGDIRAFLDNGEIFVGVTTVLNVDQVANPGGTTTIVPAPAVAADIDLVRETDRTQQTDYNAYDPFPAETHEKALDKLTLITQDIAASTATYVNVPLAANSPGQPGQNAYDSDYFYVCVAQDTWKRTPLSTW